MSLEDQEDSWSVDLPEDWVILSQPCNGLPVWLFLSPSARVRVKNNLWSLPQNTHSGSNLGGGNQKIYKDVGPFPCLKPHWGPLSSQGEKSHFPHPLGVLSPYNRYIYIQLIYIYNFMFIYTQTKVLKCLYSMSMQWLSVPCVHRTIVLM